jgi:hypothetical protein
MYVAHLAAGLAIKGYAPKAPAWALLTAVFIPDFIWIALAYRGIEPTQRELFFDDWSHSLAMTLVWATLFALIFIRSGKSVVLPVWLAAFSHFLLDMPVHPKRLAIYPFSSLHIGIFTSSEIGAMKYWWIQLVVSGVLTVVYARRASQIGLSGNLIAASCFVLLALHLLMAPS